MKEKIEQLRERLNDQNYRYYVLNEPLMSDREYDSLLRELEELEQAHPEYDDPNSPTHRVGSDLLQDFVTVPHRFPMLSLSNTYSEEELNDFDTRVRKELGDDFSYVCELKFDGTAISVTYEKGRLTRAVTRGDGVQGDDVTANVRTIRTFPLQLRGEGYPDLFEIRGEIFMPHRSFERLNQEREEIGEAPFANPRNAAAGSLKQQSSAVVAERGLDCFMYLLAGDNLPAQTHYDNLMWARKWGFKVSDQMRRCRTMEEVLAFIREWDVKRETLPYDTDGVVVKVDALSDQNRLGNTAKAPRWAVAYKFKAEQALSRLLSVDFQVGRTGAVTPVANLEPVQLAGTVVKRASLHNSDQIALLDIRLGDAVYVEKGGEIIPKITAVELSQRPTESVPFDFITHCPECGALLVKDEGEARHYCPNALHCPPQIIGRLAHFVSRKAMDIEGLGEETLLLLHNNGLVNNVADLYELKREDLVGLPRLGEKSADNIVAAVATSREVPFARVLYAIGIRFVGETTAKHLAAHFRTIDALMAAPTEELIEAEEVGEKIARSISAYFADPENRAIVERLRASGLQFQQQESAEGSQELAGLRFVISGTFERHSRDQLKALVESHGGRMVSAVSAQVDYLLAGENIGPAKLAKAEKLGLKRIGEVELMAMIALGGGEKVSDAPKTPIQGSLFE